MRAPSLLCLSLRPAPAQKATERIVTAAKAFLSTLDEKQQQSVLFSLHDEEQRKRWPNFPVSFVPRNGMSLKDMNNIQHSAAMALVESALSPRGFEKVQQIMEGDELLKTTERNNLPFGGGAMFGKDLYYISILG